VPKKVGMAPIQREGMEYEFSVVFELQMSHRASVSKDRTGLFETEILYDLKDKKLGKTITQWLKTAKPLPTREERAAEAERILRSTTSLPGTKDHFEGEGGKLLTEVQPTRILSDALDFLRKKNKDATDEGREPKYVEVCEAIGLELAARADAGDPAAQPQVT
jgi:hypothetical protein